MIKKFEIEFLDDAMRFLDGIDEKARNKIIFNIEKAKILNDPKVFKKIGYEIWEFRAESNKIQYNTIQTFSFLGQKERKKHFGNLHSCFIKKTNKVASKELNKARELMDLYFKN